MEGRSEDHGMIGLTFLGMFVYDIKIHLLNLKRRILVTHGRVCFS